MTNSQAPQPAHTPGPWLVWDAEVHGDGSAHSEWPHVMTHDGFAVCDLCEWGSLPIDVQKANARLIAAAPELLEALEDVLAWGTDTNWQNAAIAVKRAHEAIAKATGAQS